MNLGGGLSLPLFHYWVHKMKSYKKILSALLLSTAASSVVQAADLKEEISKDYSYIEGFYKWLHAHAELSFQEKETSKRVADEMRKIGLDVSDHIGGYGVVGVLKNGDGPTVLLRGDMDGLPLEEKTGLDYASKNMGTSDDGKPLPVMHACGHDMHITTVVGAARQLMRMKDQWSGTVVFVGQPAEERMGGAKAMLKEGLYDRFPTPDYGLSLHVGPAEAGKVGIASGYSLAHVDTVDIAIKGIGGHGSTPHLTKDPVVLGAEIVMALQTIISREISPQDAGVITVGSFHAGLKHNIISDGAHLQITVRSFKDEVRQHILDGIKRVSENMGRVAGLPEDMLPKVTVNMDEYTPSNYNHPELAARLRPVVENILGKDMVYDHGATMHGEDFSYFGRTKHKVKTFQFALGSYNKETIQYYKDKGERLPINHSSYYAPDPEITLTNGIHIMTASTLDLLKKK